MPGQKVADFGSGAGHYVFVLSKVLGPTGRVYAVDLNEDLLVRLVKEADSMSADNVRVIEGDVETVRGTELKDEILDGVLFSNMLSSLSSIDAALTEAVRILKKGGRVCVVDWKDSGLFEAEQSKTKRKMVTESDARNLLAKAGLMFVKSFDTGDHHYGLIFKK